MQFGILSQRPTKDLLLSPPASPLGIKAQIQDKWETFYYLGISEMRDISLWKFV